MDERKSLLVAQVLNFPTGRPQIHHNVPPAGSPKGGDNEKYRENAPGSPQGSQGGRSPSQNDRSGAVHGVKRFYRDNDYIFLRGVEFTR